MAEILEKFSAQDLRVCVCVCVWLFNMGLAIETWLPFGSAWAPVSINGAARMERERSSGNDGQVDAAAPSARRRLRRCARAAALLPSHRTVLLLALASLCLVPIAVTAPWVPTGRSPEVPGRWGPSTARSPVTKGAFLAVPPESLALGEVWDRPALMHTLMLRNDSPQDVAVERVVAGCLCTRVSPTGFVLPPGGEQNLHLEINLRQTGAAPPMSDAWPIEVPLTLVNRDGRTQDLRLSGTVRAPFTIPGGGYLQFEQALEHGQPPAAFEFTVQKHATVATVRLRTEDPRVAQVAEREVLRTATSATFAVLPRGDLPLGRFALALDISGSTEEGAEVGPYPVMIGGGRGVRRFHQPPGRLAAGFARRQPRRALAHCHAQRPAAGRPEACGGATRGGGTIRPRAAWGTGPVGAHDDPACFAIA